MSNAKVFIAVPAYEGIVYHGLPGLMLPTERHDYLMMGYGTSVLGHTFNTLWCECLNDGSFTHFAMHHADIEAPVHWLDVLLGEMGEDADVISAVVPIKDHRGLTSTGSLHPDGRVNRLTRKQLQELPPAFDSTGDGGDLVINTGLMVVRLTETMRTFTGFEIRSGVRQDVNGKLFPVFFPEDWAFSKWCHAAGLKVRASQTLQLNHHGKQQWDNYPRSSDWGHDQQFSKEYHYPACIRP